MNNDEFDVVLTIRSLGDFRTRPKRSSKELSRLEEKKSISVPSRPIVPEAPSAPLSNTQEKILSIIKTSVCGIKAKEIAEKMHLPRKTINHYLYGSLRKYIRIDSDYFWHINEFETYISTIAPKANITKKTKEPNKQTDVINNSSITKYLDAFDKLNVSNRMGKKAPHKYILLISIFSLINKGIIKSNKFGLTQDIINEFTEIWENEIPNGFPFNPNFNAPFWYMQSEPFWKLYNKDDELITDLWKNPIVSTKRQRKELSVVLDKDLFLLAQSQQTQDVLINYLCEIVRKNVMGDTK